MSQIERLFAKLKEFDTQIDIVITPEKEIKITSSEGYEHCFENHTDDNIDDLEGEINSFINSKKLEIAFQNITPNIQIQWYGDDEIIATSSEWDKEIYLQLDDNYKTIDDLITFVNRLKTLRYVECKLCYENNYTEYIISFSDWIYEYINYQLYGEKNIITNISYEISPISNEFLTLIRINEKYDADIFNDEDLYTLKIYNINSVTGVLINDDFSEISEQIAKSIIFDISRKYNVDIYLSGFVCSYEEPGEEIEEIDNEKIEQSCVLTNKYDKDLIDYYYIALQMDISEFQYLAYYRVIECLFDEVYKFETIQDIKYLVNSDSFSYDDINIINIIDIVEKYQRQKNDREKIRLVFEKYLRGSVRDEALYLANKDIIKILKDDLSLIKKDDEFKDTQKIGNIVYDFRCKCTHSNRAFNSRGDFSGNSDDLEKYVTLIKKICQRIVVNYHVSSIKKL